MLQVFYCFFFFSQPVKQERKHVGLSPNFFFWKAMECLVGSPIIVCAPRRIIRMHMRVRFATLTLILHWYNGVQ